MNIGRTCRKPLILMMLPLAMGCAALPDLPRNGVQAPITPAQPAPPRGHVLFFRVHPSDTKLVQRLALLNPATIDENTGRNGYWHVGLSLGDGRMIHAYGTVRTDDIEICGPYDAFAPGASPDQSEAVIGHLSSRLGEEYDLFEALTKGGLDDPKKPICTSLLVEAFRSVPDEGNRLSDLLRFVEDNRDDSGFISANAWVRYFRPGHAELAKANSAAPESRCISRSFRYTDPPLCP